MRDSHISFAVIAVLVTSCAAPFDPDEKKRCGNGVCQGGETCSTCPDDCGSCSGVDAGTPAPDGPPSSAELGPQPSITCPAGAVNIAPGQDIPAIVSSNPSGTTFCIGAGTHYPTSPIMPKAFDVIVGEYGAVIDGRNVVLGYDISSTSIIRGWNCTGCNDVTVRNLDIRNLATHNCVGMYNGGDNWTVDHNDISGCKTGISMGKGARITNNYVHHHATYAMGGYNTLDNVIDHNELAYSGGTPDPGGSTACTKWGGDEVGFTNVTITNNYVHHCHTTGLWLDGAGAGSVIAGNLVEDNTRGGIEWEVSLGGTVHNNTLRRNGGVAVFISNSQDVEVYDNVIEQTTGMSLQLFIDAARLDLRNNYVHDNQVDLTTHAASIAVGLSCINTSTCSDFGTPRGNRFDRNTYNTGGRTGSPFWMWGGGGLSWTQWRAIPEDANGTAY